MNIICGTDFSDNADQAAACAAAVARALGLPLKLVHVVAEGPSGLPVGPSSAASNTAADTALRSRAQALRDRFAGEVEPVLARGAPEDVLVDTARDARARLIVVSALGAKRQRSWLLGSVAERVTQCSPVPVLVVRDPKSILAWAQGKRALRVMVGADLGSSSRSALRWISELRAIGPCDLTVTEIAWPFGEHARLGTDVLAETDRFRPEIQQLLVRDLRAWAGSLPGSGTTQFVVSPGWGRIDTHLTLLAAEMEADLVVVGMHQRSRAARCWLSSVSRGVVHFASSNVACVPKAAEDEPVIRTLRSVLIPTDFSELANRAIPIGYGLIAEGGVAHLLHVAGKLSGDELESSERLRALIPRGAVAKGVSTEVHVIDEQDPGIGIWHAAGRLGVDAICMSTHGRSGLSALLMGSQVQEVVRRARQPVVLVPPEREA